MIIGAIIVGILILALMILGEYISNRCDGSFYVGVFMGIVITILFVIPLIENEDEQNFAEEEVTKGVAFSDFTPYLFPLSSMTKEQQINLTKFVANGINGENILYDWYNKNHFDYRGLIEKGLAIDATGLNIYDKAKMNF